jgi:ATP-dependent Clp protease ATP-binding subunit ClpC
MELFVNGKLNPQAFEADVRSATSDLNDVLHAAAQTQSAAIESTHFLMALAKLGGGVTQRALAQRGLGPEDWQRGLAASALGLAQGLPPAFLTEDALHPSAKAMLQAAADRCDQDKLPRLTEPILLLCGLRQATPKVRELCRSAGISLEEWINELETALKPATPVPVFREGEFRQLLLDSFSPGAKAVLSLLRSEAEGLGYATADPRHLLLALLERKGGATHYGLFCQALQPGRVEQAVMLNLRARATKGRTTVPLDADHLQPLLQRILAQAGDLAGRDHAGRITEAHLLRAFLSVDSSARRILEDEKVDLAALSATAERYEKAEEQEEEPSILADIQTIRERLRARLVGQDDIIERILPYIQRLRFGFTTPDRPVAVLLFCGQSGSGKTEMAKELARAVYGSEKNLIFLEMGQFNSRESINLFIGAPPGYVGYGEGKLTNGLRDKPQSVVLFDEVEKATEPRVLDALLRFLDEGKIDDPAGPVRDGTQCIVVMTSNVGGEALSHLWREVAGQPNWRYQLRLRLREEFKKHNFRVEFLNRVDELILFHRLESKDYVEIARRLLAGNLERLRKERQIQIELDPGVAPTMGAYCVQIDEGARAAARLAQSVVVTPVLEFIMRRSLAPPVKLKVSARRAFESPDCEPEGVVELAAG